ncbi:DUF3099 domain-containing protein [Gordonia sp. ABSL11-1]|uniref:DUF3099 domain-containing protein n=1 Tax=Gordonia sp. ABSL11-1 TaxID=3053924 RepID=UPI0025748204|nr:DUF3099 domain-containing protein [Gordonia sp. ABSL11-1]MDL9947718.1 DUF3099 domain-containing protein [Gordonia sp. ABSL11-1]
MGREGPTGHGTDPEAFLITHAQQSLEDQHRTRVRKYLTLMAFRVPALVIAGIVYSSTGSGLLALAIVAASIPIPWIAVLIANDRPPRKRGEVPQYKYGADHSVVGRSSLSGPGSSLETRIVDSTTEPSDDVRRDEHDRRSR